MVKRAYIPDRGNIVWVTLNPQKGREQKGRRPAFVLSPKLYNAKSELALMCPITSRKKGYPFEVLVNAGEISGVILADQIRALDWSARHAKFIAKASQNVIKDVQEKLSLLISGE